MKIRIHDDAADLYMRFLPRSQPVNWEWEKKLRAVQGMTLEVETTYLFKDQFNTAPVPGVSDLGLRIGDAYVAEVIDDARPGKGRCGWCGRTVQDASIGHCEHCGKADYVNPF